MKPVRSPGLRLLPLIVALALAVPLARAQAVLDGDVRLACEAILCLASGSRPDACEPSIRRYFSIWHRKWGDTVRGRLDFLSLCPAPSGETQGLLNRIAHGEGACGAAALNARLQRGSGESGSFIEDRLPVECGDTPGRRPVYIGTPATGGYWVDADIAGPRLPQ